MIGGRRVVAIVQARVGSTRLPAKVLAPLAGHPMVAHVLRRAAQVEGVDEVVAAIPDLAEDDPQADVAAAAGMRVVRGPAADVLGRYALAAAASGAEVVMRLTADCPLLSPRVSGRVLDAYEACDYVSNTLTRTFPRGLDTEVFSREALELAAGEATDDVAREHVTPFIYGHPERFVLRQLTDATDRSGLRWTVDTPEDMAFASRVYQALGEGFELDDVLALLDRQPEIGELNRHTVQKPLGG